MHVICHHNAPLKLQRSCPWMIWGISLSASLFECCFSRCLQAFYPPNVLQRVIDRLSHVDFRCMGLCSSTGDCLTGAG